MISPKNIDILSKISMDLQLIKIKLSMPDNIIQIKNSKFYLPNFPEDIIQRVIGCNNDYFDLKGLQIIDEYLPKNANIIDIGANIGNHTLYWAVEKNANKIYSFEPMDLIFNILEKNILLNNLEEKVCIYNIGLSDKETKAKIDKFHIHNMGNTCFTPSKNGKFQLQKLDFFNFKEKIDLIKINVKDAEIDILLGAKETIKKHKPTLVIESFHNKFEVNKILKKYGYKQVDTIKEGEYFIYQYKNDEK